MNSNDRANLIKRINTLEGLTDKERSALLGRVFKIGIFSETKECLFWAVVNLSLFNILSIG